MGPSLSSIAEASLADKVVLISGSSKGIGAAVADTFLNSGAKVIGFSRSSIPEDGVHENYFHICADANSEDDLKRVTLETKERFGHIDFLVNNLGGDGTIKPLCEFTLEDWTKDFQKNFFSTTLLTSNILPILKPSSSSAIVNVSSIAAMLRCKDYPGYGAAKAAILSYSKSLSEDLSPRGIRVFSILPGIVETEQMERVEETIAKNSNREPGEVKQSFRDLIPFGRYATPNEIAAPIVALCTGIFGYATGVELVIDGGMSV